VVGFKLGVPCPYEPLVSHVHENDGRITTLLLVPYLQISWFLWVRVDILRLRQRMGKAVAGTLFIGCYYSSGLSMRCCYLFRRSATRSRLLCVVAGAVATVASMVAPNYAGIVTFGSGTNTFNLEFVTIGNAGNTADEDTNARPLNAGSVGYTYAIGKFEVSEGMIANYNSNFGTANGLAINTTSRGTNRPATNVSWNEAARFVNWLNTSTGNHVAYKFTTSGVNDNIVLWTSEDAGYNASNPYRNSLAKYVLPSYNEWYKAAFYNPSNSAYYDFANGSNTRPTAVTGGTEPNTAVYTRTGEASPTGPADVDQAGGLSPYGVMGLNGNVREWEESSFDLTNSSSSSSRGVRGGDWLNDSSFLFLQSRGSNAPSIEINRLGFRVASITSSAAAIPEPTSMAIFGLSALCIAYRARRNSKS
jgi:sulfatase modifying factor 1